MDIIDRVAKAIWEDPEDNADPSKITWEWLLEHHSGDEAISRYRRMARIAVNSATLGEQSVVSEIAAERCRQVEVGGYDTAHDDGHPGEMAAAAAAYAELASSGCDGISMTYNDGLWSPMPDSGTIYRVAVPEVWPWGEIAWKPKNPRRDLVRAAALIVAEIERMDRAAEVAEA